MDLKLLCCALPVHDHDAALAFYRDILGFEERRDLEFGVRRQVSVGSPSQPGVQIVLELPRSDPGASSSEKQAIGNLMETGLLGRLVFATDNCDQIFERIEAAGAEVVQEPIDQSDGVRDCAFFDPSGNILHFAQLRGHKHKPSAFEASHDSRR